MIEYSKQRRQFSLETREGKQNSDMQISISKTVFAFSGWRFKDLVINE